MIVMVRCLRYVSVIRRRGRYPVNIRRERIGPLGTWEDHLMSLVVPSSLAR